jgi:multiple sugar transport system substrate-binding protein
MTASDDCTSNADNTARLNPDSAVPIYHQLKTKLFQEITTGIYGPGDRLPTEHELCERYSISRTPAHRALSELATEGVIVRIRKRGTFVNPDWVPSGSGSPLRIVISDNLRADQVRRDLGDQTSVEYVEFTELREWLMEAVAEGSAPDIALVDGVWIASLANAHVICPLDDLDPDWVSDYEQDSDAVFIDEIRVSGHIFAVPEEVNVAGVWYDRDRLAAHHLEPPTTWEEFRAAARELQSGMSNGEFAVSMPGGTQAGETTSYCLAGLLGSNGAEIINGGVRLDSALAVEALRLLRYLIEDGSMSGAVASNQWLQTPRLVGAGRAAIGIGGSYEAEVIAESAGMSLASVWDRFVFTPFPAGPRGGPATAAGAMAYVVLRQSSNARAAMRLVERLTTPERLAGRTASRPMIPARLSSLHLLDPVPPFVAETARLFSTAVNRPQIPEYPLVSAQLQTMVEAVITGTLRPAAAVERTADIIGAITGLPVMH